MGELAMLKLVDAAGPRPYCPFVLKKFPVFVQLKHSPKTERCVCVMLVR